MYAMKTFLYLPLCFIVLNTVKSQMRPMFSIIKDPTGSKKDLDLAFTMDTTGSMGPYIRNAKNRIQTIVNEVVATSAGEVKLALIEYRDHPPQDKTFVTKVHDFTVFVSTMKSWLEKAKARGGGDTPEAVAEALFKTSRLSWTRGTTKVAILVADAPPHGLVPKEDRSFPDGSPYGHDPIKLAKEFAKRGIVLYVLGIEPPIVKYKPFFQTLAYITGGQYIPLSKPKYLTHAVIGGAKEALSLRKFEGLVKDEIKKASAGGGKVNKEKIAKNVFAKLKKSGVKTDKVLINGRASPGVSNKVKTLAQLKSLAEVRKKLPQFKVPLPASHSVAYRLRTKTNKVSTEKSGITLDQVERLVQKSIT